MKVHKVKKIKIVILSPMFYDTKTTLCTFGKYVLVKIGNVFLGADNKRVTQFWMILPVSILTFFAAIKDAVSNISKIQYNR